MILTEYLKYSICKTCFLAGFTFLFTFQSYCQDTTATNNETIVKKDTLSESFKKERNHAVAATLMSTVLPGSGQLYNGKWWKVPIIYGAGGYLTYNAYRAHQNYTRYRESLIHVQQIADTALKVPTYPYHLGGDTTATQYSLREKKNEFRKIRDRSIIYLILLYTLNIVDANVDAHLQGIKVSKGMIMTFRPDFIYDRRMVVGLNLTF